MSKTLYSQTKGVQLLEALIERNGPIFSIDDAKHLARDMNFSDQNLRLTLSRLAHAEWITRIKRGIYIVDSPVFKGNIHPFAIVAFLVEPMAISHWSALVHHGLTTQIPVMIQATTPKKVVTPEMREGRAIKIRGRTVWRVLEHDIEFIYIEKDRFFGHEQYWVSEWHQVLITDRERTLLDMVARPDIFGGFDVTIETYEENFESINASRLVEYAIQYDMGSVVKRLGWLLEEVGAPARILRPLIHYPVKAYYPLDPGRLRSGPTDSRWRIINNLKG